MSSFGNSGAAQPGQEWLGGLFLDGMFGTTAKVVAVMLPPAAIFFPLFTILEESGYLPRVAYLLDAQMSRSGACGRQALTMCMGCGCNAVGVTGCRIIGSERERLLAILTNSFVPCNGRFPLLIALGTFLFAGRGGSFESAVCLMGCLLLSVWMTFAANAVAQSDGAARRAVGLRDGAAALPAAKAARGDRASLTERVLHVLGRAAMVAAPAGAVIWAFANVRIGGSTLLTWMAGALEPVGCFFGMNGTLLLAFCARLAGQRAGIPAARDDRGGRRCARRGRGDGLMAGGERLGLPDGAVRDGVLPVSLAVQHDSF